MVQNTYEEVEDGHVDDVEEPVAWVIGIQLLYGVTEERIHLPPLKTDNNDIIRSPHPETAHSGCYFWSDEENSV